MDYKLINFCEFDKYAVKSYCAIHGVDESANLGDITKVDEKKLPYFNFICGGSPCQDFSLSGKLAGSVWRCRDCGHEVNPLQVHWSKRDFCEKCGSKNLDKTRSSLLVEWLRVIREVKPMFGIYENVKNIVQARFLNSTFRLFEQELQEYGYNTYWKILNAKNYGIPQNRERVYLVLIKKECDNGKFVFPEPMENGRRLMDILEDEVDEKYYLSDDKVQKLITDMKERKAQVVSAAKAAHCDEFIRRLPEGYDTILGENGSTLSGGERQRISIARALLKNAPIILLDEATASLDPENEVLIQQAIARLVEGKTVIMIAHRLRTVVDADQILVLNEGELMEQGTHKELLEQKGLYSKLFYIQQESLGWSV